MKRTRERSIAVTVCVVALSAAVLAQAAQPAAPAPALPTRTGTVMLSGENPVVRLLDKLDGATTAQVSYWRIHWSPVGPGHVCYVTVGEQNKPGAERVAVYDNPKLLEYLTKEVLGTFNKSYLEWPFTPVGGAAFTAAGDHVREHRETCKSDKYSVELAWRDLQTPGLVDILPGSRPTNPFGITFLRIPAGSGAITINGKPAPGTSFPNVSFLAFGETWIK